MRHDPQNDETSNTCKFHGEYFGSCPICHPKLKGDLVETIEDIGSGISSQSWYDCMEIEAEMNNKRRADAASFIASLPSTGD